MIQIIFTASAFLFIILVLFVLYEIPFIKKSENKWIVKSSHGLLGFITNYPLGVVAICYTVICLLVLFVDMKIGEVSLDGISIIGFVGTIIGLIVTYLQLKHNNNQFYGYFDFYRIAEELLDEKSNRTIRFHFTTPIPGHISYGEEKDFNLFKEKLLGYKGKIEFVIPDQQTVMKMYYVYENTKFRGETYSTDIIDNLLSHQDGAKENKRLDVARFVSDLRRKENASIYYYEVENDAKKEKKGPEAIENLYISDGILAVYAIPLHFLTIQDENRNDKKDDEDTKPFLVGLVTSDRSLVTSFDENFEKILHKSKKLSEGEHFLNYDELEKIKYKKNEGKTA